MKPQQAKHPRATAAAAVLLLVLSTLPGCVHARAEGATAPGCVTLRHPEQMTLRIELNDTLTQQKIDCSPADVETVKLIVLADPDAPSGVGNLVVTSEPKDLTVEACFASRLQNLHLFLPRGFPVQALSMDISLVEGFTGPSHYLPRVVRNPAGNAGATCGADRDCAKGLFCICDAFQCRFSGPAPIGTCIENSRSTLCPRDAG